MVYRVGFWFGVLVVSVFVTHWGAEHLSDPLEKIRRQWGLTAVAGGTLIGLAAASPEIAINTTSAYRDVSSIGLGNAFGANILSIPLMVTVGYLAMRKRSTSSAHDEAESSPTDGSRQLPVRRTAVTIVAIPYLLILLIVGLLTLPASWRGLQPIDAVVLGGAYLLYVGQALLRGRTGGESVKWSRRELVLAGAGLVALAVGAYFAIRSTENLVAHSSLANTNSNNR